MSRTVFLNRQLASLVFLNKPIDFSKVERLYLAFHTKFPGFHGTQLNFEVSFDGYERVAIDRSDDFWEISDKGSDVTVSNKKEIDIPNPKVPTTEKARYISIGLLKEGAGSILHVVEIQETMFELGKLKSIPVGGAKFIDEATI